MDQSIAKHALANKNQLSMLGRLKKNIVRDWELLILCIPMLAFYIIFHYGPMYGAIIAFKNFSPLDGIMGSPWAGLRHFQEVFNNPFFPRLVRNTFLLGLYSLLWGFPIPIIFALLINEVRNKYFKRVAQTLSYLPFFISTVIVAGLMWTFLSPTFGVVNAMYTAITGNNPINFMTSARWFRTLFIGSLIWQTFGWNSIIYIAALAGVDVELYDSAKVDGANRIQQLIYITFPGILPTIFILLILSIGGIMSVGFERVILLYTPSTYIVADILQTYAYRTGILEGRFSRGAAVGLFNSVINVSFLICANTLIRKYSNISLW